ncbi:MAG TPA: alpha/beta hydrolase-fold protein [Puia sp.]|nr:alpha/beta hydrolase-fold protein [Puia sp.]
MRPFIVVFCVIIFQLSSVFGQNHEVVLPDGRSVFALGVVDRIRSVELGESRILNIYLPDGYSPDSSRTYPVIYLLDGSYNEDFIHVAGIVQFLNMIEAMPESIVVGIANVDRRRDFTFPTGIEKDKKAYPTTGSSARFISFMEKELEPYIREKYRTNHVKTIIGQSLGGLLAIEILLEKPYLFDNYIIVSPSLWWNNESLLTAAPGLLDKSPVGNFRIIISVGAEGKEMEGDAKKLSEILQTSGGKRYHTTFLSLPKEDHLTILHNSVYKSFQLLYPKKSG